MKGHREYWETQVNSGNRSGKNSYLLHKASEHALVIKEYSSKSGTIIDVGCGAGELLEHLDDLIKINSALDYSKTMLDEASKRFHNKSSPRMIHSDALLYLPTTTESIWISTGALSQYLDGETVDQLVGIFASNQHADTFILFDTIDPLRYMLVGNGISYLDTRPLKKRQPIKNLLRSIWSVKARFIAAFSVFRYGRDTETTIKLNSIAMGYAHPPREWMLLADKHNLDVDIISSRYFEYRYHVILKKICSDNK
jgi:SAM-dependent methyltransferase